MQIIKRLWAHREKIALPLALFWTILLAVLSLFPVHVLPKSGFNITDKGAHMLFYFFLMFFWLFSNFIANGETGLKKSAIFFIGISIFFYGIIIEVLQELMPYGRSGDWKDVVANTLGIGMGIFISKFVFSKLRS